MSQIVDPNRPLDDPRQVYFANVMSNSSMTWFSQSATPRELVTYVLELLGVDFWKDLTFNEYGSAQTRDKNMLMAALAGPCGSALTVWAFGDAVAKVNAAIGTEYDAMMDEMSRGEYSGNAVDAWRTALDRGGAVQSDHFFTANDEVFTVINAAEVVPVFDAVFLDEGSESNGASEA